MMKAVAAVAVAAIALLATGSAQPRPHAPAGPLGLVTDGTAWYLARLNARTLRAVPGQRLELGYDVGAWASSPDKATVAVGVESEATGEDCVQPSASLRFASAATLAGAGDLSVGSGSFAAVAWLAPERLVVVLGHCAGTDEIVVVDPRGRRVLSRSSVSGYPRWIRQGGAHLVMLSSSAQAIEAARLMVVDADGTVRSRVLDRIEAGFERLDPAAGPGRYVSPGLAVTPDGRRAYVVSADGLIATVDLASLSVAYDAGSSARVLTSSAKRALDSSLRAARVLPTGMLAVTGSEDRSYVDSAGQEHIEHVRAGLALVDTKTWTGQMIDRNVDSFTLSGRTLLATGSAAHPLYSSIGGPSNASPLTGSGLTAYTLAGAPRFHRFAKREVAVIQAYGKRAFLFVTPLLPLKVVDLQTGNVIGTRDLGVTPEILHGASSVS
jgi:hypothetical protein